MPPSEPRTSADVEALTQLRAREIAAAEAGEVEALLALRTDDFAGIPPGHPPVEGLENVGAFLTGMVAQVEIEEELVSHGVVLEGDLAYDRGHFTGTARPRAGGAQILLDGKYPSIAVRGGDDGWKYAVQMWSDNTSPAPA